MPRKKKTTQKAPQQKGPQTTDDYCFGSPSVVSVSSVCDEELAKAIRMSDFIRHETLRRLWALPSTPYKPTKWQNAYYDYFRKQVMKEYNIEW